MIHFDIATKIVSPDTNIWVVFPGRGRRYLETFLANEAVFLETPALDITPAAVNEVKRIRQHVRMSLAFQDFHKKGGKAPSRRVATYPDDVFDEARFTVLAANVRKLFGRVKVGDLIVVPGKLFAPVFFGEVIEEFDPQKSIEVGGFAGEKIQYRAVKWVSNYVPRNLIPADLQIYLSKPPAIAKVPRLPNTDEFFRFAYKSYVLAEKSAVIIDGPRYTGKNPLDTIEANYLVSYFIAAFNAIESDKLLEFSKLDVSDAITRFYSPELVVSYTQNFNSPGRFGLIAASSVLAIFVGLGATMAISKLPATAFQNGISVKNSLAPGDDGVARDAGVKLDYLLKSLGKDQIEDLQKLGDQSRQKIDLQTPVKMKEAGN